MRVFFGLAILAVVLAFAPGAAFARAGDLSAAQGRAIRHTVEAFMEREHAPGATIAVGVGGRVVWTEGFGFADIENRIRATADTAYRTASIGKSMTATAAMELTEQGRLDLDAPIQRYCPRFPEKPWPITSRHLVSHTSGIRHYGGPHEQEELFNTRHYDRVSDAVDIFAQDALVQQPGADFVYTTWGYVALGCVLEGATGEEYRALMQRLIFGPAGMSSTRDDDPQAIVPNRARGYILEDGVLRNSRWVDMSSKMAAGGFITTAPDLVRFMNAWMAGRFVSAETRSLMLTPYVLPDHHGTVDGFGMGWFLDEVQGMRAGFYGGGTPQVSGIIMFIPERDVSIAGIFNLEGIEGARRTALIKSIAEIVLGPSGASH